jgi:benzoylformate decarboxylase
VWYNEPVTAQDVPAAIARAFHEATAKKGPAIVVVPMDDWLAPFDAGRIFPAPDRVEAPQRSTVDIINEFAESLNNAKNPIIVAGAGNASDEGWDALVKLAEKTQIPVYQESFAARAGFPQDHKLFSGFLSSSRTVLRSQLASHDVILAIGAPVFRQYNFEEGEFFSSTTQVLLVTEDPEEAYRSPVSLALISHLPSSIAELSRVVNPVIELRSEVPAPREVPPNPSDGEPLRASHVLAVLAGLVAKDSIIVEETPSTRPDMHELLPATNPLGFVSAAMGGLGFGLPAAIGLRLGAPNRPVVAILGDGSSLYGIQGLWSARHYNAGVLFIILNNERYAVMDRLAERVGDGEAPWPAFSEIDFAAMAESFGVASQRIQTHDELVRILNEVVPTLRERQTPLALIINVEPENKFAP